MREPSGKISVTLLLFIALVATNYLSWHRVDIFPNPTLTWPLSFVLCVMIAARILRGHDSI